MQIIPLPHLRPYIKHYLFLDICLAQHGQLRIFADGNTGIVFCLGPGALFNDGRQLPKAFIYGQIADYRTFESNGPISLLIVVFRPFGMHGLLRFPTWELKNNMIDLEAILGMGVHSVQERLHEGIIKQRMAISSMENPEN